MRVLREQQKAFASSVIEGVNENHAQMIRGNNLGGARRLNIYRHSITIGLSDALAGVYDVVKKLVGDVFFAHIAEQYIQAYPSQTGNVHDFGEAFPEFLKASSEIEALPYLPDVARLEWAYHAVFHSPVAEVLNIEKLMQVPESRYDRLTLVWSPYCLLLHSNFPVLRIWQTNQDDYAGDKQVSLDEGGDYLAILREGKQIAFHPFSSTGFAMLNAIAEGEKFTQACEIALRLDPDCNVQVVLQTAVLNRMIIGFTVHE